MGLRLKERLRSWKWAQKFFHPAIAAELENAWRVAADNHCHAQAMTAALTGKQKEMMNLTNTMHQVMGGLVLAHGGNFVVLSPDMLAAVAAQPWVQFRELPDGSVVAGYGVNDAVEQVEPTDEELAAIEQETV